MQSPTGFELRDLCGGSERCWLADDLSNGDQVVLRWVRAAPPDSRLAAALTGFSHPAVVPVRQFLTDGRDQIVVSDAVSGRSLGDLLDERCTLRPGEAVGLVDDLADGLRAAHRRGLGHGALNPECVLVDDQGRPLLTDLAARCLTDRPGPHLAVADLRGLAALAAVTLTGGPPPVLPPEVPDEHGLLATRLLQRWSERAHRYGVPSALVQAVCAGLAPGPRRLPTLGDWAARVCRACSAESITLAPRGWPTVTEDELAEETGAEETGAEETGAEEAAVEASRAEDGAGDEPATGPALVVGLGDVAGDSAGDGAGIRRRALSRRMLSRRTAAAGVLGLALLVLSAVTVALTAAGINRPAPAGPTDAVGPASSPVAVPSGRPASPATGLPSAAGSTPDPVAEPAPAGSDGWRGVLLALDQRRGEAFAHGDRDSLTRVHLAGASGLAQDTADLAMLTAAGAVATGVRHEISDVQVVSAGITRAQLLVTDRMLGYNVVRGDDVLQAVPPGQPRRLSIELRRFEGEWRIASMAPSTDG